MKLPLWLRNSIGARTKSRKRKLARPKGRSSRLMLEPLEERVLLANIFWNVDANGAWNMAGNWSSGTVPGAADDVFLDRPAGNFTITHGAGDFAVNSIHASKDALVVAGGTLTIAVASELGDFSFTSLVLNGSLTTSGAVNNHGTIVQHDSGSLTISGEFTNSQGGLYDIQNDNGIGVLGQGSFVNLGTLRKSGGAGTSTISTPVNNSGGTLEAQTGVLSLTGGGTFTSGVFSAAGGAFLDLDTSHIAFAGTITGSGAGLVRLRNGLTLGPSGATFNFNGQWVNGTWILGDTGLTNSGTLATAGPDNKAFSGLFTNSGTFIHRATGDLQVGYLDFFSDHPGTLNNTTSGVIDFQADSNLSNGTNAPLDYVNNAGIIRKSAGAGNSTIFAAINFTSTGGIFDIRSGTFTLLASGVFTGGGVFNASAGATLELAGGNFFVPSTMSGAFTGSGGGTVRFSGSLLVISTAGTTFDFAPGLFHWTAYGQSSTLTGEDLTNLGSITLDGVGFDKVSNVFNNAGTMLHAGIGNLSVSPGGTLTNLIGAVYDFQADQSVFDGGTFINRGTLRKSGGTGTSSMSPSVFQNEGGGDRCPARHPCLEPLERGQLHRRHLHRGHGRRARPELAKGADLHWRLHRIGRRGRAAEASRLFRSGLRPERRRGHVQLSCRIVPVARRHPRWRGGRLQ